MKRKEFIYKSGATALLISLGFDLTSCSNEEDIVPNDIITSFIITQSPFDVLQTEDAWLRHPEESILLVNVEGAIRAFTSVCPHLGCDNQWEYEDQVFNCNCHGAKFSNEGTLLEGPATTGLTEYMVIIDGDNVNIAS